MNARSTQLTSDNDQIKELTAKKESGSTTSTAEKTKFDAALTAWNAARDALSGEATEQAATVTAANTELITNNNLATATTKLNSVFPA